METEKVVTTIPEPVNMDKMLQGKVAMITGGSSGIGKSIAEAFLKTGCKVVICGTNEEKLKKAVPIYLNMGMLNQ